jgi:hypothetical protein
MRTGAAPPLARPAAPPVGAVRPHTRRRAPLRLVRAGVAGRVRGRGYWMALRGVDVLGVLTGGIIGFFWHPPVALLAMLVAGLVARAEAAPGA